MKGLITELQNIKNSAKNLEDVKELNLSLIIKLVQKMKLCSRADLAKASGLRQSTITNIINDLIDYGIVYETGDIKGRKGRRSIGIAINSHLFKVIGVRLTRTSFIAARFDISGNMDCSETVSIAHDESTAVILEHMKKTVRSMISDCDETILGIGIAVPGPYMAQDQRIALMTGSSGWEKVKISNYFSEEFKIPVFVEHDANAGVLAEWWFGYDNLERGTLVYVAAGQGIGSGIMVDGKIFHGSLGIAGEIGHMSIDYDGVQCQCGNRGCLENYCSVLSMVKKVNQEIMKSRPTVLKADSKIEQIAKAARENDALAIEVFESAAWFLGFGLSNLVNVFNPHKIIIGDELTIMGDRLMEIVTNTIRSHVIPEVYENLIVRFSSFHDDPALIGAAALAVDKLLLKPSLFLNKK